MDTEAGQVIAFDCVTTMGAPPKELPGGKIGTTLRAAVRIDAVPIRKGLGPTRSLSANAGRRFYGLLAAASSVTLPPTAAPPQLTDRITLTGSGGKRTILSYDRSGGYLWIGQSSVDVVSVGPALRLWLAGSRFQPLVRR